MTADREISEGNFNLSQSDQDKFAPFLGDKWIASSAMQKAMRRGDVDIARRAARALTHLDRAMLLRRFQGTIVEDISPLDVQLIANALSGPLSNTEIDALLSPICETPGDRSTDYALSIARFSPRLAEARRKLGEMPGLLKRLPRIIDSEPDYATKCLAVWYAAGTDARLGASLVRRYGNYVDVFEVLASLGVPPDFIAGCAQTYRRIRNPLPLFHALSWLELQRCSPIRIRDHLLPTPASVRGIPLYALGGNTRLGKTAIKMWVDTSPTVQSALGKLIHSNGWRAAAEVGVFHTESGLLRRRIEWDIGGIIEKEGIEADFIGIGACVDAIPDFLAAVKSELHSLDAIRAEVIERAVRSTKLQLSLGGI